MPTLSINVSRFRGASGIANGLRTPNVSRHKCIKFAIGVGNSHFTRAFSRTQTALALSVYRAMAVRCVLDFSQANLQFFPQYRELESTEKLNLSYWIGMTFAAIAASEVLGVTRTIHAQRQHGLVKVNKKSMSLADLVGQDAGGRWHVIEAKGRQTAPTAECRREWKEQARTIRTINGARPLTKSYSLGLISNPCSVELIDPPSRHSSVNLKIDSSEISGYYKPFIEHLQTDARRVSRVGRTFILRPIALDPKDNDFVYVGLEEPVFRMAQAGQPINSVKEFDDREFFVGADGVVVLTSQGPCDI